eukprot:scaffold63037_cov30-Phaeocystis_antarctica.AAC.1
MTNSARHRGYRHVDTLPTAIASVGLASTFPTTQPRAHAASAVEKFHRQAGKRGAKIRPPSAGERGAKIRPP